MMDPLLYGTELPLQEEFHPLGFPLTVRTNSPLVLRAARRSFGGFPRRSAAPAIEVRFLVTEQAGPALPPPPVFRAQRNLMVVVADSANFATCDLANGFAFGSVSRAVAADADLFRFHFLEAIAYTLLTERCVTPVHASCVARREAGVLLCGAGGAGKSTLAYGCARAGWTLVSDNASYLLDGTAAVAGRPQLIRFRPTAAELFPELAALPHRRAGDGKIALDVAALPPPRIATAFESAVQSLVFLARREGPVRLLRMAPDTALDRLVTELPRYRDEVRHRHRRSLLGLVRTGAFELQYSRLDDAMQQLEGLVERG